MKVGEGENGGSRRGGGASLLMHALKLIPGLSAVGTGTTSSPLRDRLLPSEAGEGNDNDSSALEMEDIGSSRSSSSSGGGDGGRGGHGSFGRFPSQSQPGPGRGAGADSLLTGLYWQQWMLQRRLRRSWLSSELLSDAPLSRKLLLVLEAPVTLLRDLSIPTLQPESWSKLYAVMHPFAAPLLLLLALGSWHSRGAWGLSAPTWCLLAGIVPSGAIYLLTHHSRPPSSRVAASLWVLCAFLMCVTWIYLLAGELVNCLESLGVILAVPSAYLGLTVLAWGNSIGDFFSNTSLARRGLGEMAVAGCYGGPVFNILVGLALSIGYACLQTYPLPFVIRLDTASIVSLIFLYISLGCTVALVAVRGWRLERGTGFLLVGLYVVYSVVQAGIVLAPGHGKNS